MRFVDTSRVRVTIDHRIASEDGIDLSVDIYRPARPGQYPVLITRTASDNNRASWAPPKTTAPSVPSDRYKLIAEHGFVVVAADVRGRGDSGGEFVPFVHERGDGVALASWARSIAGSNGRVGAFGSGYSAFAALSILDNLDAAAVWSPFGSADIPGRGGVPRLDWLFWNHLVAGRFVQPPDAPDWESIFRHRPLSLMHEALGRVELPWAEWISHLTAEDPYWAALDLQTGLTATTPTLFVSGWWDAAATSTLQFWGSRERRCADRLVVGPWDSEAVRHPNATVGGVAWGPSSMLDHDEMLIDWFRSRLAPSREVDPIDERVRVFTTGRNNWTSLEAWPPPSEPTAYFLQSEGNANSRIGDGRLVIDQSPTENCDNYTHDPDDPVRWQPLGTTFSRTSPEPLTMDTEFVASRDDVLVYVSAPQDTPLNLAGVPIVHLRARTDADDADWFVALEDVFPGSGRSVRIAHGIVRGRTVEGFERCQTVDYSIPLTGIAHEIQPGHSMRLVVTSSCFPLYAINGGTDEYVTSAAARVARQTVFHGGTFGTRLILPIVSKTAIEERK